MDSSTDRVNNWSSLNNAERKSYIDSPMYVIFDNFRYVLRNSIGELLASSIFTLQTNLHNIIHISR